VGVNKNKNHSMKPEKRSIFAVKPINFKLLVTGLLVLLLFMLIGSQIFYVKTIFNKVLTSITFVLVSIFGIMLVRTVRLEMERKEELQKLSDTFAKANDKLRRLDNAKNEFISIASHQLRTPLTAIKGFVSMLLESSYGKLEPKQEDALNKAYISNERLIELVEDLLILSRIESGRLDLKLEPVHLEDMCREVMETFTLRARDSKLTLKCVKPKKKLPEITIDRERVREVIFNLIDNAIKYTPHGEVRVSAERRERNREGGPECVRISIADTGIGISKDEMPFLFTKFSRGRETGLLNTGGAGLGLYVGKQIIEANGGSIWAESKGPGQGSRFFVELPIEQKAEILDKWG
jgi:signal transduction histidine kinase